MITVTVELEYDSPNHVSPYSYNGTYRPSLNRLRYEEEDSQIHQIPEEEVDESREEESRSKGTISIGLETQTISSHSYSRS